MAGAPVVVADGNGGWPDLRQAGAAGGYGPVALSYMPGFAAQKRSRRAEAAAVYDPVPKGHAGRLMACHPLDGGHRTPP